MLQKIAGTLLTRMIAAVSSFIALVITSKVLGAEIRGEISIIVLGITIIALVNEIFGGPALVYFIPRNKLKRLLIPAYAWALVTCASLSFILYLTGGIPREYAFHTFAISLLQCTGAIHFIVLLGREKIRKYNFLNLAQTLIILAALAVFVFMLEERTVNAWIWSMYAAYGITFILSVIAVIPELDAAAADSSSPYSHIVRNGFFTQLASLSHLLTNRISFYFLLNEWGNTTVGIFSTGAAVVEALLLLSSSVAMVIYARIANSADKEYARRLTLRLAKLCFVITVPGLILLILLPSSFYTLLFGAQFGYIGKIALYLGPGILALSFSSIITHYFSGTAKNHINTISAVVSLAVTSGLAFMLIPRYQMAGAAIAASAGHCVSAVYLSTMFLYESKYSFSRLFPGVNDYMEIKRDIKNLIHIKR